MSIFFIGLLPIVGFPFPCLSGWFLIIEFRGKSKAVGEGIHACRKECEGGSRRSKSGG